MIADPAAAPARPDLAFLARRSRAKPPRTDPALADFIAGRAVHPNRKRAGASPPAAASAPSSPPPSTRPAVSFERPAPAAGSLDLSAPSPPAVAPTPPSPPAPRAPNAPAPASGSLDLSAPSTPAAPPAAPPRPAPPSGAPISFARPGDSLDLSDPPAPAAAPVVRPPAAAATRVHQDERVRAGEHRLLGIKDPTVTLTRVQSGIGQLGIEAVCSPEIGDLRLGAAYQLRGGGSSTVQYADGNRFAPSSRRPVIVAGRDEYEHLRLDLRQVREFERMAVYAFSESRTELTWGGTLVVTTFGGARIELPLETLYAGKVAVLLSIYNLAGEFVVRAEMETITGDVREAARAYGYDRITWRDDRSPVD